jgi:hypothetical protein
MVLSNVLFYCRWAVENFRSANAFLVEPPQFNAALVGMQMSAGVRVGRAAEEERLPGRLPLAQMRRWQGRRTTRPWRQPTEGETLVLTRGASRFRSPGEEGVSMHASDQELSADSSSSSDEAPSESADAAGGGASDGGSPAVPPGRVQRAVEKLEGA